MTPRRTITHALRARSAAHALTRSSAAAGRDRQAERLEQATRESETAEAAATASRLGRKSGRYSYTKMLNAARPVSVGAVAVACESATSERASCAGAGAPAGAAVEVNEIDEETLTRDPTATSDDVPSGYLPL